MPKFSDVVVMTKGEIARTLMRSPGPIMRRLAGPPIEIDGKTLHPQMQLMLWLNRLDGPALESLSISRGRRRLLESAKLAGGRVPVGAVTERKIDGPDGPLSLRFYTPRGMQGDSPALVFFHGGGWMHGSLDSHDALCRFLTEQARVRVISVDYRLAPEAPFPAAFDDCFAAWNWVTSHARVLGIDPERIAIGGDSAGGNLAAVIAQETLRTGLQQPNYQVLIYPATDFVAEARSRTTFGEGFYLTKDFMDLARENYLVGDEDLADRRLSPLRNDPTGVAPALVVTAGFDPLLDEGEAYADRLRDSGVEVEYRSEESLIHGFANLVSFGTAAPEALQRIAASLHRHAHPAP